MEPLTKQQRAQIKRMRQSLFRANQWVNGEGARRLDQCQLDPANAARYFDGHSSYENWLEETMRAAVGPIYDALTTLMNDSENGVQ